MSSLKVLSIDWDYFVKATAEERAILFPDGGNENLGKELSRIVWGNHYIGGEMKKIKADSASITIVKKCLNTMKEEYPKIMIADSHKHAYSFVYDYFKGNDFDNVEIVNVDFHHDIYNMRDTDEVDCGNWFGKLMKCFPKGLFTWVCRKDSDMDISDSFCKSKLRVYQEDLTVLNNHSWDMIYICRSGMWSPPHLDKDFKSTFEWVMNSFKEVKYQKDIFDTRYDEKFQSYVETQKEIHRLLNQQWCGM